MDNCSDKTECFVKNDRFHKTEVSMKEGYSEKRTANKKYNVRVHFREQGEEIDDRVVAVLKDVYINECLKKREWAREEGNLFIQSQYEEADE